MVCYNAQLECLQKSCIDAGLQQTKFCVLLADIRKNHQAVQVMLFARLLMQKLHDKLDLRDNRVETLSLCLLLQTEKQSGFCVFHFTVFQ